MTIQFSWNTTIENLDTPWRKKIETLGPRLAEVARPPATEFSTFKVGLVTVSDQEIEQLNTQYRDQQKATDVLTFNYYSDGQIETTEIAAEVYVSYDTAKMQAAEADIALEDEMALLYTHGLLHAIGYDHEISAHENRVMRKLESEMLSLLGLKGIEPVTV